MDEGKDFYGTEIEEEYLAQTYFKNQFNVYQKKFIIKDGISQWNGVFVNVPENRPSLKARSLKDAIAKENAF